MSEPKPEKIYSLIRTTDAPDSDKQAALFRSVPEGWGVLRNVYGLGSLPYSELLSVHPAREAAQQIADDMNQEHGELEYLVHCDPESDIYRQVTFRIIPVVLAGVKARLEITEVYREDQL